MTDNTEQGDLESFIRGVIEQAVGQVKDRFATERRRAELEAQHIAVYRYLESCREPITYLKLRDDAFSHSWDTLIVTMHIGQNAEELIRNEPPPTDKEPRDLKSWVYFMIRYEKRYGINLATVPALIQKKLGEIDYKTAGDDH